jgi:hypothetical protein
MSEILESDCFTVIDSHHYLDGYTEIELECCNCGHEFIVDTQTDLNMVWIGDRFIPQCPHCNYNEILF